MSNPAFADPLREAARAAASYVHSCQVEDGGFFFARIPPGSLRDTYFAVKTLHMLGQVPRRTDVLNSFLWTSFLEDSGNDAHALYLSTEILEFLGQGTDALRSRVQALLERFEPSDRLSNLDTLYLEVVSELEDTLELASLFVHFRLPFNRERVVSSVRALSNADGGFGKGGASTPATTYYAAQILSLLGFPADESDRMLSFLDNRSQSVYYLEDLYYLETTRSILGRASSDEEKVISFVLDCQRIGGGFARARPIGIPTLEYTCYAVSIIKLWGAL